MFIYPLLLRIKAHKPRDIIFQMLIDLAQKSPVERCHWTATAWPPAVSSPSLSTMKSSAYAKADVGLFRLKCRVSASAEQANRTVFALSG